MSVINTAATESLSLGELGISFAKNNKEIELLCLGRAGVDLYVPEGASLASTTRLKKSLGGSAANVAVGLARLGHAAALLTRISDDALGRGVLAFLKKEGVNCSFVLYDKDIKSRTSLALLETRPVPEVVFYRNHPSDLNMQKEDIAEEQIKGMRAIVITGTALSAEPSRAAVFHLLKLAKRYAVPIFLDIDYRPYTWKSKEEAADICFSAAGLADVLIANSEETELLCLAEVFQEKYKKETAAESKPKTTGQASKPSLEKSMIRFMLNEESFNIKLFIAKQGRDGLFYGYKKNKEILLSQQAAFNVKAKKPYGAGDAFLSAFLAALLADGLVDMACQKGQASAAMVVSREGCAEAMPSSLEINAFLEAQQN